MPHVPRWKIILIAVVVLIGTLYAFPNVLSPQQAANIPSWLPNSRMSLGLDLRGGSHLLLEVDMSAVLQERMQIVEQGLRAALRKERIGYTTLSSTSTSVLVTLNNPADLQRMRQLLRDIEVGLTLESGPNGQATIKFDDATVLERRNKVISQSIEIVRRRIDEFGTTEPTIQQQGEGRILVQVPGLDDPERLKRVLGQTARLSFRMVDLSLSPESARQSGRVPPGSELMQADSERDPISGRPMEYLVQRRILVGGDNLIDAQGTFQNGQPVVNFRFDTVGARRFADATRDNVGKPFAIVLDNKIISAPVIREPILGGSGVISGNFTTETARDLALLLRAGALPAPLRVIEERTVGPDLGANSIAAGKFAGIVGIILVVSFMVLSYGLLGIFANIAMAVNLVLLIGALTMLHATLTLPGIAGIVLTLGMAVDANVLIYERIREEVRNGRSVLSSVDAGFERAWATIVDSNITTLIAGLVMFELGSGPVRGFAVTLSLGILTSMFTAVMVTRLIVVYWLRWRRPKVLPI